MKGDKTDGGAILYAIIINNTPIPPVIDIMKISIIWLSEYIGVKSVIIAASIIAPNPAPTDEYK